MLMSQRSCISVYGLNGEKIKITDKDKCKSLCPHVLKEDVPLFYSLAIKMCVCVHVVTRLQSKTGLWELLVLLVLFICFEAVSFK